MGRIIAVGNQKGGVGKSATVTNLGAALALEGQRVLLVDYDPQRSLTLALTDGEDMRGDIVTIETRGGVTYDLLTGDDALAARKNELRQLDRILGPLRGTYDYIIIDCPPSLSVVTMAALYAADKAIVTTQPHYTSVIGIGEFLDTIDTVNGEGGHITSYKVLITMLERNGAAREMVEQINSAYDCYETQIRKNVAIVYSEARGMDVFKYDVRCNAAKDYKALALEVMSEN